MFRRLVVCGAVLLPLACAGFTAPGGARADATSGAAIDPAPRISPTAGSLAWLVVANGTANVWVRTLGQSDDHALTHERGTGVERFLWSPDGSRILFFRSPKADGPAHLYTTPLAGGNPVDLTPFEHVAPAIVTVNPVWANEILVAMNDRDPAAPDVYRVNLTNGQRALEVQNDLGATAWLADHNFVVRLAFVPLAGGGMALEHRESLDAPWTRVTSWDAKDAPRTKPVAFGYDNRTLFLVTTQGAEKAELRGIDVTTGSERRLARDPVADVAEVLIDPTRWAVQAVAFARERLTWLPMTADTRLDFAELAKLSDGVLGIESQDLADHTWVVSFRRDDGSVRWFLYDRRVRTGTPLFPATTPPRK